MTNEAKDKAVTLLRRYDKLKAELMQVERELSKACADYGRSANPALWGYSKDMLRNDLKREEA